MADYRQWLSKFSDWLKDVNDHEVKEMVQTFVESKQALKDLSKDKYEQYKLYLQRDIDHFIEHEKHYNALAWEELKESLWYELAHIEDKSQLEWLALSQDFKHKGVYRSGEWIAMGTLVCQNCHYQEDVYHASEIKPCPECGGVHFNRQALQP
ncbi:zinc ribbon-containing protein [Pseudoalteromonas sp. SSDWG2]|uniref:zinc ribbon-containing protein n=1 Tax=Pseudoalteromonas sp. SSDWG2 TaxID=3139391 RepID=UPI003BACA673